jgi:aryl-alcohol dehydrogenase-like predicted oxidoreductase
LISSFARAFRFAAHRRYVSLQPRYNLPFRETERELLPFAEEEDLAVIPFNPLSGGLLTDKYRKEYCGEIQTSGGI